MAAVTVRDARAEDEDFILGLNAQCVPAVAEMSAQDYRDIAGWAHRVRIAEADGKPAGFIVLIRPGSTYPSLNYAWFELTFGSHLYIDRVAVSAEARGLGIGRALYEDAVKIAREAGEARLTAEVNEQPPNPQSLAFHARLGFRHLLSRPWKDKVVAMLAMSLPGEDAWQGDVTAETRRFAQVCRQLADECPFPETAPLDETMSQLMTELWDQCFSQTEIRSALQRAMDELPGYAAGEERRPNTRYT